MAILYILDQVMIGDKIIGFWLKNISKAKY
jgi:hypothetical protein